MLPLKKLNEYVQIVYNDEQIKRELHFTTQLDIAILHLASKRTNLKLHPSNESNASLIFPSKESSVSLLQTNPALSGYNSC